MKYLCSHQEQVTRELRQGKLPELWDDTLRAHIAGCRSCSDLVLVAQALQQDRMQTMQTAQAASAGALWWRAQVRLRNGAMERVTRPIALAEKFALIITAAVVLAVILWKRSQLLGWLVALAAPPHSGALPAGSSFIDGWTTILMVASVGTVALCVGLAVYLLREEE